MNRIRVVILTSSTQNMASLCLPKLAESNQIEIAGIILNQEKPRLTFKKFRKILRKALKIGPRGALNGYCIRSWFNQAIVDKLQIQNLYEIAASHQVEIKITNQLNSEFTAELLRLTDADLGISLANPYISKKLLTIPKRGFVNIHHECLPEFRGAQSVIWSIHEGLTTSGYTIHQMNAQIDAGAILHRQEIPIDFKEDLQSTTVATTSNLYMQSVDGLVELLEGYDKKEAEALPQVGGRHFTTPSYAQFRKMHKQHDKLRSQNAD